MWRVFLSPPSIVGCLVKYTKAPLSGELAHMPDLVAKPQERRPMTDRNANRPGYKKTPVGWIPEDWECTRLGAVFTNRKKKGREGLPVLAVTMDRGVIPRNQIDRKMAVDLSPAQSLLVEPGDIAYNMMRMWQGAVGVCNISGVISPAYVVCRPQKARADARYMHHLFKSHLGRHLLTSYSYGIHEDRLRLYFDAFALVPIPLPPLEEQKRIASILSSWDAAIDQTRALIAAAKRRKKALSGQLFKEKRQLVKQNRHWQTRRLGDLVSINPDTLPESAEPNWEFKYIDLSSVESGKILPNTTTRFSDAASRARRLMKKGDILLATVRPSLHGYALVDFDASDYVCSTGFAVLRPKADNVGAFIYQVLFSDKVQKQFYAMVTGSSYPALNEGDVASVHVRIPEFTEQRAIADVLTTADAEIRDLESKAGALERQKKGLMQKLLTGEVRVRL